MQWERRKCGSRGFCWLSFHRQNLHFFRCHKKIQPKPQKFYSRFASYPIFLIPLPQPPLQTFIFTHIPMSSHCRSCRRHRPPPPACGARYRRHRRSTAAPSMRPMRRGGRPARRPSSCRRRPRGSVAAAAACAGRLARPQWRCRSAPRCPRRSHSRRLRRRRNSDRSSSQSRRR